MLGKDMDAGVSTNREPCGEAAGTWDWKADAQFVEQLRADLRKQAAYRLRSGTADMSASSLVQESLLRLLKADCLRDAEDRAYVYAIGAQAMRCVIVDHIRASKALKRGGKHKIVPVDGSAGAIEESQLEILALHEALEELSLKNTRMARVVDLKFFGSLSMPEISQCLGVHLKTVEADWTKAKKWLLRFMDR